MAKPWSRYQVGFINHPKFQSLPSSAICLWLEGKNYADEHLTDGYLPFAVIKGFRFYTKRNAELLMQSAGQKDISGADHFAPLWAPHAVGVKMHDYLDHNECAEAVRARIAQAGESRDANKQRQKEWRDRQGERRKGKRETTVTPTVTPTVTVESDGKQVGVTPYTDTEPVIPPNPPGGQLVQRAEIVLADAAKALADADRLLTSDDLADRARAFIEQYPAVYATAKHGATYRVKEARDFDTAIELVSQWPDLPHLTDMLRLFLLRKDFAPKNEPGSPRQFAFMAPQCDAMLREAKRRGA